MSNYISIHKPIYRGRYEGEDIIATFFYDPDSNVFINEDGIIIYNILKYVTAAELQMFKENIQTRYFPHTIGGISGFIELIHPDFSDDINLPW